MYRTGKEVPFAPDKSVSPVPPAPGYNEVIQPGSEASRQLASTPYSIFGVLGKPEVHFGSRNQDEQGNPVEAVYEDLFNQ